MPHIDSSAVVTLSPIELERVILINRTPVSAITDICKMIGVSWMIIPKKSTVGSPEVGKLYIYLLTAPTAEVTSPVTITDAQDKVKKIQFSLVDNVETYINDLFLRASDIRGSITGELISVDGFTGTYHLLKTPYGLDTIIPVIDEFNSDSDVDVDTNKWKKIGTTGPGESVLYVGSGRLQMEKSAGSPSVTAILSHDMFHIKEPMRARVLEVSFLSMDADHYWCYGFHTGDNGETGTDQFILGVKVDHNGNVFIIKDGGAPVDTGFDVTLVGGGTEIPYQFVIQILGETRNPMKANIDTTLAQYILYIKGGDFGPLDEPATTVIGSGTISFGSPAQYLSFCPAYTTGKVEATVIQGAVLLDPEFTLHLREKGHVKGNYLDGSDTYYSCPNANWEKWNLQGHDITLYDIDDNDHAAVIEDHNENAFTLVTQPGGLDPDDVRRYQIADRQMTVSVESANDFTTHAFVKLEGTTPSLNFYAGEIPTGKVGLVYHEQSNQTLRLTDIASVAEFNSNSGIPDDEGYRKLFQEAANEVTTITELMEFAKTFMETQETGVLQGTATTNTDLVTGRVFAGMSQDLNISIGGETFTSDTHISSLTITDVGGGVAEEGITFGGLKDYIRNLLLARLRVLHKKDLVIDDLKNQEKIEFDFTREINNEVASPGEDIDVRVGSSVITNARFDEDGVYLSWKGSSTAVQTELRTDDNPGSTGSGFIRKQNLVAGEDDYTIATGSITSRKYTFYIYDVDTYDNYSPVPTVITLKNSRPIPKPFKEIQVLENQTVHIELDISYDFDVTARKIYVSNVYLEDAILASDKDLYFTPDPYLRDPNNFIRFTLYDTKLYVTMIEEDCYSGLDNRLLRYDRVITTTVLAKPPKTPVLSVLTFPSDTFAEPDEMKLHVSSTEDGDHGKPETFHFEFQGSNSFPDPVDKSGTGAVVASANTSTITIPKAGNPALSAGDEGNLLVLKSDLVLEGTTGDITAFADAGGGEVTVTSAAHGRSNGERVEISGTTNYNGTFTIEDVTTDTFNIVDTWVATETGVWNLVEYWYQGRYISDVDTSDPTDYVLTTGEFVKDAGTYNWDVWTKWYEDLDYGSIPFPATADYYSLLESIYKYSVMKKDFSGYVRVFAVNKYGITAACTPVAATTGVQIVQAIEHVRAYDFDDDASLQVNQIRVEIPKNDAATTGAKPKYIHLQLYTSSTFPEPSVLVNGADDAVLTTDSSHIFSVLVPNSYDLTGMVGKILVIDPGSGHLQMGRFILAIQEDVSWEGSTWHKITINGTMPPINATMDWEIWSVWDDACTYAEQFDVDEQNYNNQENYIVTLSYDQAFTGFVRAYFQSDYSTSDGVVALEDDDVTPKEVTIFHGSTPVDPDVPSKPTNIRANAVEGGIHVEWDPPVSNINTLIRYLVRVSDISLEGSDYQPTNGDYEFDTYSEYEVPGNVTFIDMQPLPLGTYAIGVIAVNSVGNSVMKEFVKS